MSVRGPSGDRLEFTELSKLPFTSQLLEDGSVAFAHSRRKNGWQLFISLSPSPHGKLKRGVWNIELRGRSKRFDAWILDSKLSGDQAKWKNYVKREVLIGTPGSSPAVLTVGAFVSRIGWKSDAGFQRLAGERLGDLAPFSCPGPTRDGRAKPELVSPGSLIVAPTPLKGGPRLRLTGAYGTYTAAQGTSQAAPHLAGGIALLLQAAPSLDLPTLRKLLIATAERPRPHRTLDPKKGGVEKRGEGKELFNRFWGFGKVNIYRALEVIRGRRGRAVGEEETLFGAVWRELPADGESWTRLYLIPRDSEGWPTLRSHRVLVTTTAGKIEEFREEVPGIFTFKVRAPKHPTRAEVRVKIDDRVEKMLYLDFLPPDLAPQNGWNCNIKGGRNFPPVIGLVFALFLLAFEIFRKKGQLTLIKKIFHSKN